MSLEPDWLARVRALDVEQERITDRSRQLGVERALVISDAVDSYPRGNGRDVVAELLGCTVGRVDQQRAKARAARAVGRPLLTHLPAPGELLERLYALELANVMLTGGQQTALRHLVRSLVIDATWLGQLGGLLASEYAEAAEGGDVPADEELVKEIGSWSPLRALAVLHDLTLTAPIENGEEK